MQVRVKMITTCASPIYGNMGSGDIVACDARFARHLVEEIGAAEYLDAPPPAEPLAADDDVPVDADLSSTDEPAAAEAVPPAPRKKK